MADETPASDTTSAPTPIDSDEPEDGWITPGKVRQPRLAARPTFELHAVGVHLPALPSDAPAMLLEVLPAFIRAAKLPTHTCADVSVYLRNRNRLAILKTHHIELVSRLLSVESITLAGHTYSVAPYLAAPTNSCRGVIHGVAPDATPDELLRDLDCYQADILLARRMGNTTTALLTFAGLHVPYSVYYHRLEFRCRPHKPRAHHCTICLQYGHRTCACPGNQRLCPTCSTAVNQPEEPHSCSPWCLHCQGHHAPFSATCPVRKQRDEACANAATKQRLQHRQQWKSVNTPQAPAKASTPSAITEAPASSNLLPKHAHWGGQRSLLQAPPSSVRPTTDVQPQPTAYQKPAPVKQDLPLQKPVQETWQVLPDTLLSDHHLIEIKLTLTDKPKKRITLTNRDLFRRLRVQESRPSYDVWVNSLKQTRSVATTTTQANPPSDRPDPHLMRLWRRRKRLLSRIRTQPSNTQLSPGIKTQLRCVGELAKANAISGHHHHTS
ncbi:hypothetical protein MTO96_046106 [Rhipicephalus appendiculatus]